MNKKILVIDDEKDLLKLLKIRLENSGYDVTIFDNGNDGIHELQKNHYDLIILDLIMPVMDGYEFYDIVKKDIKIKDIPILILTADVKKETEKKIQSMKAAGYLKKPFDAVDLIDLIKNIV